MTEYELRQIVVKGIRATYINLAKEFESFGTESIPTEHLIKEMYRLAATTKENDVYVRRSL